MLMFASDITAWAPGNAEHYIIPRDDLRGLDSSVQNQILQRWLELLLGLHDKRRPPESSPSPSHMQHDASI
jgi:hypothetical protein